MAWHELMRDRPARGGVALVAVLVMLLPLLLGLLPPLPPTEAFAMERDIAASRCLDPGAGDPASSHDQHDPCCILCPAAHGPAAAVAEAMPVPARLASARSIQFAAGVIRVFHPIATGFSARGPPAA